MSDQPSRIDDLEDGETYHYVNGDPDAHPHGLDAFTFVVSLDFVDSDDFADYGEGAVGLHYRDGYAADVPVSNFAEQLADGKVARGAP